MNQGNVERFAGDDGYRMAGCWCTFRISEVDRGVPEVPVAGLAHRRRDRPPDRRLGAADAAAACPANAAGTHRR